MRTPGSVPWAGAGNAFVTFTLFFFPPACLYKEGGGPRRPEGGQALKRITWPIERQIARGAGSNAPGPLAVRAVPARSPVAGGHRVGAHDDAPQAASAATRRAPIAHRPVGRRAHARAVQLLLLVGVTQPNAAGQRVFLGQRHRRRQFERQVGAHRRRTHLGVARCGQGGPLSLRRARRRVQRRLHGRQEHVLVGLRVVGRRPTAPLTPRPGAHPVVAHDAGDQPQAEHRVEQAAHHLAPGCCSRRCIQPV